MGIAAKHFDPIVGLDMHLVPPPGPVPPLMMPVPFAGYLIDPNDYGSRKVFVNGFFAARAGTPGVVCPPHIPPGGMFVKPPTNECEMFQGSSTVVFGGEAAAAQGHPVLSCHDVGMPARIGPCITATISVCHMASTATHYCERREWSRSSKKLPP